MCDSKFNHYALKYVDISCAEPSVVKSYVNEIELLKVLQGNDSIIKLYEWLVPIALFL